jgi:hypothetical protein
LFEIGCRPFRRASKKLSIIIRGNEMKKFMIHVVAFSVIALLPVISWGMPINTHIISDGSWRSSDMYYAGWEEVSFNDSGWANARSPYPNPFSPQYHIPGTTANHIWHDPNSTSNGSTGANEIWLRKKFTLNILPDSLPLIGQALISVDDDYEFFVNGHSVLRNDDGTAGNIIFYQFVDFTNYLQPGANVFAIHAADGKLSSPHDQLWEHVVFDGIIKTISTIPPTIPEPSTLLLLGCGLAGIVGIGRKRLLFR